MSTHSWGAHIFSSRDNMIGDTELRIYENEISVHNFLLKENHFFIFTDKLEVLKEGSFISVQ